MPSAIEKLVSKMKVAELAELAEVPVEEIVKLVLQRTPGGTPVKEKASRSPRAPRATPPSVAAVHESLATSTRRQPLTQQQSAS